MKTQSKHRYVRCEVNVTEFNVERGFAASGQGKGFGITETITEEGTTNLIWSMVDDGNGNFRNMESYQDDTYLW